MEYLHSYDHEEETENYEDEYTYDFSYLAIAGPRQSRTVVERKKSNALERKRSLARQKSKRSKKQTGPTTITEDTTLAPEEETGELAHLPDNERLILTEQTQVPDKIVTYKQLYRYATRKEKFIIVVAIICCIAGGAALPLMNVVFGKVAGEFSSRALSPRINS